MFELIQLRCFVAVAEELHFGRAAARLNMTQPPLSRHIQVLERIVGLELVARSSRSVRLTAAGVVFLAEARRIVELSDSAVATARAAAEGQRGMVALGFTAASGYSFLPSFFGRMRIDMPDVKLLLKEMVTGEQLESLQTGRLDIGLLRPPVRGTELASMRVLTERFVVCRHDSIPAHACPRTLADFDGLPIIMYAPDKARYFHDLVTGLFANAHASPQLVQHVAQIHTILTLVGAGHGYALVPEASTHLHPDNVVFSELENTDPIVELHAAWRQDNVNPALRLLLTNLRRWTGEHGGGGGTGGGG
ncbi:LysR family transcriptional regulator [Roseomonas aeriglobus]|nr:LysR family transcriptional regulator [Roseomonas aeriglobus]